VSEARNITDLEGLEKLNQKKESSTLKSHGEILDLFKELETIEEKILNPEIIEEISAEPEIPKQHIQQTDITGEVEKKPKQKFLSKLQKKKKIKEPKKWFLKLRRNKSIKTEDIHGELKPVKSTFTLKINNQGNLIGLNIKKPITKTEKKPIRKNLLKLFKKGTDKEAESVEKEEKKGIKGIPGKITGILSKIKLKKYSGGKGEKDASKVSGSVVKIKGIFSKKSKK